MFQKIKFFIYSFFYCNKPKLPRRDYFSKPKLPRRDYFSKPKVPKRDYFKLNNGRKEYMYTYHNNMFE
jgi:hypothetical protein